MRASAFSSYHPLITALYFTLALLFTVFSMHPVVLALSFCASLCYYLLQNGGKQTLKYLGTFILPLMLVTALINPLFNRQGGTVMTIVAGLRVTGEAVTYGLVASVMFASSLIWFSCAGGVMTTDKLAYLFGKRLPSLCVLLSVSLRFIPRFTKHITETRRAMLCLDGVDARQGKRGEVKGALRTLSASVTWALESAIITADAMRARGYGTGERSVYALYRFTREDAAMAACLVLLAAAYCAACLTKSISVAYFPAFALNGVNAFAILGYAAFGVFCFAPVLAQIREEFSWRYIRSKA
jgi:energy-coupling factor transport system permease protein